MNSAHDVEVAWIPALRSTVLIRPMRRPLALALICVATMTLASCASNFSSLPSQLGGLPRGTPERPASPAAYPAVHDMPPPRSVAVLTEEQKRKEEAKLAALRAEQARRAATAPVE